MLFSGPTPAALPPDGFSRCSAESRLHYFPPKQFDFLSVVLSVARLVKPVLVAGLVGRWARPHSVSATLFPPDQTAARKSPHLWEFSPFFFFINAFLLSLHLPLPAHTCLRGSVASALTRVPPNIRPPSRLCAAGCAGPSYHVRMLTHKVNFRHAQLASQGALGGFKSSGVTLSSIQSGATCRSLRLVLPEISAVRRRSGSS